MLIANFMIVMQYLQKVNIFTIANRQGRANERRKK